MPSAHQMFTLSLVGQLFCWGGQIGLDEKSEVRAGETAAGITRAKKVEKLVPDFASIGNK